MLCTVVKDELDLPPPWGTTGFEPRVGLENESIPVIEVDRHAQNERSLLQARLRRIYDQVDTNFIEKDLIDLAIKWNRLDSSMEFEKVRLRKKTEDTVYTVRNGSECSKVTRTVLNAVYVFRAQRSCRSMVVVLWW